MFIQTISKVLKVRVVQETEDWAVCSRDYEGRRCQAKEHLNISAVEAMNYQVRQIKCPWQVREERNTIGPSAKE